MSKYKVPDGMLKAIWSSARFLDTGNHCLAAEQVTEIGRAVCQWITENPPEITAEMAHKAQAHCDGHNYPEYRYMFKVAFLAPDPDEGIKDLLATEESVMRGGACTLEAGLKLVNDKLREAYRRGCANAK